MSIKREAQDVFVGATCLNTECVCANQTVNCEDEFIRHSVENMKGWVTMMCNNKTKVCQVEHEDLPVVTTLSCIASECVSEYVPPPEDPPCKFYKNWN